MIITGLFITALVSRNSDIILIAVLFIFYPAGALLAVPSAGKIRLSAERKCSKERRGNVCSIVMNAEIKNCGSRNICIIAKDRVDPDIKLSKGNGRILAVLSPGEKTELEYSFQTERGVFTWDKLRIETIDPLGCFNHVSVLSVPAETVIQPQYSKFKPFITHPWKTLSSPGTMETRMSGSSTDFHGVREYRPGDPLKALYWKLTARYPDRYFIREFVQERNADMAIIVDSRQNMEYSCGDKSIFELQTKLAASLAGMFIRQGHRTGLSIAGPNPVNILPGYGKRQLNRILNCLAAGNPDNKSNSITDLVNVPLKQYSSKTQYFFLSPFDYDDIPYYRKLRSQGFQIVLVCPDIPDFIWHDTETADNAALRISRLERRLNLDILREMAVTVIDWRIGDPVLPMMAGALRRPPRIKKF